MIYFRLKGYRIVHVHWLYIFPLSFIMKGFYYFCRLLGIKIIWEMHNIIPHGHTQADKKASRWFYKKSDAVIFHSKNDIERAKAVFEDHRKKTHIVIPHGNFNESYENVISKNEARRALDIPEGNKVILCFGFIRKNRGYEYLMEAVEGLKNTTVVVAGKMQDRDVYELLLDYERRMTHLKLFVHWIPDEQIQVYFNACDVVVLPYTDITTSGVIPLAYAFSKPVVTTSIGGINDIVHADIGILVPPQDSDSLRKAIMRIFTMDMEAMGKRAHAYAEKEFSWVSNAQKIKALYELISKPVVPPPVPHI